jgi:hypothetical protein
METINACAWLRKGAAENSKREELDGYSRPRPRKRAALGAPK